jgi:hypothetical protein
MHRNTATYAPSTSNTVTEQMSWVGGLGEVKVSSVLNLKGNL